MLSAAWHAYISLPRGDKSSHQEQKKSGSEWDVGQNQNQALSAVRQGAVHERAPAGLFPLEAAHMAGRHLEGGQGDAPASAGGEPEPSGYRRPGFIGNRSRHRAARARPPAQADRQDRRSARAHRRWYLRLLRGDRRADLDPPPGSAPDRDAVGGSAGAPRAARAGVSRRLITSFPLPLRERVPSEPTGRGG